MGDKLKQNDSPGVVQDFEEQERCIRLIAKELLSSDTVDVVIGFQEDDIGGSPIPLFARSPNRPKSME